MKTTSMENCVKGSITKELKGISLTLHYCSKCERPTHTYVLLVNGNEVFECSHCDAKKQSCAWKHI